MFKYILFFLGGLILGAAYLYFLEVWRPGCLIIAAVAFFYFIAAVAMFEK